MSLFVLRVCVVLPALVLGLGEAPAHARGTRGLFEQSPIDILSNGLPFTRLVQPTYAYIPTELTVKNTGSPGHEKTIEAFVVPGTGSVTVDDVEYELERFHFHSRSEHRLNGLDFDMELHMVHFDAAGNALVVGRWITKGAASALLDPIFSDLPASGQENTVDAFNVGGLYPANLRSYRYDGSLTTAPYSGPVKWVMFNDPLEMSHEQITAFRNLFPDGNTREPQPLNGRTVLTDVPAPGALALFGLVGLAATRRRRGTQGTLKQ